MDNPFALGILFLFGLMAFWAISVGFAVANFFHVICLRVYRLKQFFPHAYFLGCYCAAALVLIAVNGRFFAPTPNLLFFVIPLLPILHFISLRIRWKSYRSQFVD